MGRSMINNRNGRNIAWKWLKRLMKMMESDLWHCEKKKRRERRREREASWIMALWSKRQRPITSRLYRVILRRMQSLQLELTNQWNGFRIYGARTSVFSPKWLAGLLFFSYFCIFAFFSELCNCNSHWMCHSKRNLPHWVNNSHEIAESCLCKWFSLQRKNQIFLALFEMLLGFNFFSEVIS